MRTRTTRPASTEISPSELERIAHTLGLTIDLPGPDGGWARIKTPAGHRYHAWTPAVTP